MSLLDDVGQKVKGKVEKTKGEVNQQQGEGIKGGMQKIQGEVDDTMADAKLKNRADREDDRADDDH